MAWPCHAQVLPLEGGVGYAASPEAGETPGWSLVTVDVGVTAWSDGRWALAGLLSLGTGDTIREGRSELRRGTRIAASYFRNRRPRAPSPAEGSVARLPQRPAAVGS